MTKVILVVNQTDLASHFYCSWVFDSSEPGTDIAGCSFHQSTAAVALETFRMKTLSCHRHIAAEPLASFPQNLKDTVTLVVVKNPL